MLVKRYIFFSTIYPRSELLLLFIVAKTLSPTRAYILIRRLNNCTRYGKKKEKKQTNLLCTPTRITGSTDDITRKIRRRLHSSVLFRSRPRSARECVRDIIVSSSLLFIPGLQILIWIPESRFCLLPQLVYNCRGTRTVVATAQVSVVVTARRAAGRSAHSNNVKQ